MTATRRTGLAAGRRRHAARAPGLGGPVSAPRICAVADALGPRVAYAATGSTIAAVAVLGWRAFASSAAG